MTYCLHFPVSANAAGTIDLLVFSPVQFIPYNPYRATDTGAPQHGEKRWSDRGPDQSGLKTGRPAGRTQGAHRWYTAVHTLTGHEGLHIRMSHCAAGLIARTEFIGSDIVPCDSSAAPRFQHERLLEPAATVC